MSLAGSRRFSVLATAFVLTGAATVTLGSVLPELRRSWDMDAARASWLFTAQFAASSLGSVISTLHLRLALVGGYLLVGVGLLLLGSAGPRTAFLALALMGFGLGNAIPATNLVVALEDPATRGAALARVNLVWGLGATGFPALLAALAGAVPLRWVIAGLGVFCCLASLPLSTLSIPRTTGDDARSSGGPPRAPTGSFFSLLPFAFLFFLYVGTEMTFGGWMVTLAEELETVDASTALLAGSTFWAALLVGRGLAGPLLRRMTEARLYALSLGLAGLGAVLLLLVHHPVTVFLGAGLGGLGLAALFPLNVSFLARFAERVGITQTGWIFAAAGLGAAVLPWIAGRLADRFDSTRFGFAVACLGLVLIGLQFARLVRREELSP